MLGVIQAERQTIAGQREQEYELWRTERLSRDPRLGGLHELSLDISYNGFVSDATWQSFRNEKYSRAAERLKETHHERPDYFAFDHKTGDVVISEADGVHPRYTLRNVYQNGLQKSRELADADPRFAFQLRRDELFMDFYEDIEVMMRGSTNYDTIEMVSTLPIEQLGQSAFREKHYDDEYGKQFKYTVRRTEVNGQRVLEMRTTTWYSPKSDLQSGGTVHGKQAVAAVLESKGFTGVPFALLTTDEFGAYRAKSKTAGRALEDIDRADTAVYDMALKKTTGNKYSYGRQGHTIEAYALFDHCAPDWHAYGAYYEQLARHLNGEPMASELQLYMIQLVIGYKSSNKKNNVLTAAQFQQLEAQIENGRITPDMALACNEILDYAHSARLADILATYKETGQLPDYKTNQSLTEYSDGSASASAAAVESGRSFDDCEDGNGVSTLDAAMELARNGNVSLDEAMRRLFKKKESKEGLAIWAIGECVACLQQTAIAVNKCNMCALCEDAHTSRGDVGLNQIMKEARTRRAQQARREQEGAERAAARRTDSKKAAGKKALALAEMSGL